MTSGECIKTLLGHTSYVKSVEILGKDLVASCSWDETIRIWDTESGECTSTLSCRNFPPLIKKISNEYFASGNRYDIHLWNINSCEQLRKFVQPHNIQISEIDIVSKERMISIGFTDETIHLWDVNTGKNVQTLIGNTSCIGGMCVLSNDRITTSSDSVIKMWCLKTNSCIKTIHVGSDFYIEKMQLISTDKIVTSSQVRYADDALLQIWDLATGNRIKTFKMKKKLDHFKHRDV